MASTSKDQIIREDEEEEEEEEEKFEHFDDFTLASSWERFISEIEAVCRQWLSDGLKNLVEKGAVCLDFNKNLYKVKSELKYALKSYCMEYYFETTNDGKFEEWEYPLHDLQLSFGVKDFLVIAPQSASGVVLDAPEASKLLSAVAIALSNCSSLWPAFVPVHIPSRKAYIGIQNMGTVFTKRFEADRISSQVPIKLMHLEGLYELFVSKFVFSTVDLSMELHKVYFKMKLTYRTITYDEYDDVQMDNTENMEIHGDMESNVSNKTRWDDNCPWSEWFSAEDPVKGLEVFVILPEKVIHSSLDMAELENVSPLEADKWFIYPHLSENLTDISDGNTISFATQLRLLVDSLEMSLEAQFMEDFVSAENSGTDQLKSSTVLPPPTVLDRVLKDLFHEGGIYKDFDESEQKGSRLIKGALLESLFAQFCLHALWFGNCNLRAIAVLWIEFVREVRWCWEESQPLPRMLTNGTIDLSTCLINQKLQMLAICIEKKRPQDSKKQHDLEMDASSMNEDFVDASDSLSTTSESPDAESYTPSFYSTPQKHSVNPEIIESLDSTRKGSAGVLKSMMLLNSEQCMHIPFTQDPPLMTEDMHEERLQAVEAFGHSFSFSAQLEKDILSSDMSAFKAANPEAVFEDFIRWHSPRDWENDEKTEGQSPIIEGQWPPRGKLSDRMSDKGNSWRKLWNDAPSLSVSEQKPLLDPNQEGEKVLHYLETVRPYQLLEQMVCTAFKASADLLRRTSYGNLDPMTTKIDQLYLTMASILKYLQVNNSISDETTNDLKRLCEIFQHVEKLLTLAASLHRKFTQAPRLSEEIFTDIFTLYLPKMGTDIVSHDIKEFIKKQVVKGGEREVVASMFTPPTANQSWRKVLSMGNLLNGHEPILREIIFSKRDHISGSYYADFTPRENDHQEIETYRMYISGTSNDLGVALAIASCD